ncbi:hypothetical protein HDV00_002239 [Rhizophlyctis rosea]|nr:hypothetical protein HDV00_002239 [Rhizophlyctis rosea]
MTKSLQFFLSPIQAHAANPAQYQYNEGASLLFLMSQVSRAWRITTIELMDGDTLNLSMFKKDVQKKGDAYYQAYQMPDGSRREIDSWNRGILTFLQDPQRRSHLRVLRPNPSAEHAILHPRMAPDTIRAVLDTVNPSQITHIYLNIGPRVASVLDYECISEWMEERAANPESSKLHTLSLSFSSAMVQLSAVRNRCEVMIEESDYQPLERLCYAAAQSEVETLRLALKTMGPYHHDTIDRVKGGTYVRTCWAAKQWWHLKTLEIQGRGEFPALHADTARGIRCLKLDRMNADLSKFPSLVDVEYHGDAFKTLETISDATLTHLTRLSFHLLGSPNPITEQLPKPIVPTVHRVLKQIANLQSLDLDFNEMTKEDAQMYIQKASKGGGLRHLSLAQLFPLGTVEGWVSFFRDLGGLLGQIRSLKVEFRDYADDHPEMVDEYGEIPDDWCFGANTPISPSDFASDVKAAIQSSDIGTTRDVLSRIRNVLDHDTNVLYHGRFRCLLTTLEDIVTEDATAVDVDVAAGLEHLLHSAKNTGWLFRHMNIHLDLHQFETELDISTGNHDQKAENAEKDFAFMKKNVRFLSAVAGGGSAGMHAENAAATLELDPNHLMIKRDQRLGGGGFAHVFAGTYQGRSVAVKHILKSLDAEFYQVDLLEEERMKILVREARRESHILYKLQPSPHTIGVHGWCVKEKAVCVVMEPAVTSLAGKLGAGNTMTWWAKMVLLRDIALCLDYMHSCQLIHRDLKPGNILIDKDGRARIADAGGAASSFSVAYQPTAYTPHYAPTTPTSAFSNDIYAFGRILEDVAQGPLPPALQKVRDACLEQRINSAALVAGLLSIHTDFGKWDAESVGKGMEGDELSSKISVFSNINFKKSKIRYGAKVSLPLDESAAGDSYSTTETRRTSSTTSSNVQQAFRPVEPTRVDSGYLSSSTAAEPRIVTSDATLKETSKEAATKTGKIAIVLYDYNATEPNEISLRENDMVTGIDQVEDDWWQGTNINGETGLFPSNYVKLRIISKAPPPVPMKKKQASVNDGKGAQTVPLHNYDTAEKNEASFQERNINTDATMPLEHDEQTQSKDGLNNASDNNPSANGGKDEVVIRGYISNMPCDPTRSSYYPINNGYTRALGLAYNTTVSPY